MDTDLASLFWFVVPGIVVPAVLLVAAFRAPTPRQVDRWAEDAGLDPDANDRQLIRSQLGRARRWRSCAAFPFWWLAFVPVVIGDRWPATLTSPFLAVVFYVVGGLAAELSAPVPSAGEVREAALTPRRVGDYLPSWARRTPWVLLGLATTVVVVSVPAQDRWDTSGGSTAAAAALVIGVAVAVLAEVVARAVVDRPQRTGDPSTLRTDDALRCTAVSSANAAAMLAGLSVLNRAIDAASPRGVGWWYLPVGVLQLALAGLAVGALALIVRQELWGVRRRPGLPDPAST